MLSKSNEAINYHCTAQLTADAVPIIESLDTLTGSRLTSCIGILTNVKTITSLVQWYFCYWKIGKIMIWITFFTSN